MVDYWEILWKQEEEVLVSRENLNPLLKITLPSNTLQNPYKKHKKVPGTFGPPSLLIRGGAITILHSQLCNLPAQPLAQEESEISSWKISQLSLQRCLVISLVLGFKSQPFGR
jgi:hypothetical protein